MERVVFTSFKPKKILEAVEKIGSEESNNVSSVRLHLYVNKVFKGQFIKEVKLRKVFLGVLEAEKYLGDKKKISKFYSNLINIFKETKITSWDRWILAIRHTMFSTYESGNYHFLLKTIFKEKLPDNLEVSSLANKTILRYVNGNEHMKSFYINNIYNYFIESSQGVESIYEELGIRNSSKLFHESIVEMIIENIEDICIERRQPIFSEETVKIVKKFFSEKDRKVLFKKILNIYAKRDISPKNFDSIWFEYIYQINGGPKQMTWWVYSEEEKNTFRRWWNFRNITDFFENYAIYEDRKKYWYKWINAIEDTIIIEGFNLALIMKFKNHLIIEFGKVGAIRIYENEELSIREIRSLFNNYTKARAKSKIDEEYREIHNSRWKHQGNWQWRFNSNMDKLGYRK